MRMLTTRRKLAILTRILALDRICICIHVRILTRIRVLHPILTLTRARILTLVHTRVSQLAQKARASITAMEDARLTLKIK